MLDLESFRNLRTYDLVVLDLIAPKDSPFDPAAWGRSVAALKKVIAGALTPAGRLSLDGFENRHVVCRVEKPTSKSPDPLTICVTLRSIGLWKDSAALIDADADGKPVEFQLMREFVSSSSRDPFRSLKAETESDKRAIADPLVFLRECEYEWLPHHGNGGTPSVRDRLGKKTTAGLSEAGMWSMLEFRTLVTQRTIEQVTPRAADYIKAQRLESALRAQLEVDVAKKYAAAAGAFGGDIPGSTELTSDIDINTFGDGTEFAVEAFNRELRLLFRGTEPGIALDVNIYGKDFLPKFEPKDAWKRKPTESVARHLRPVFDHNFSTWAVETEDALRQLVYGLVKLRRYMVDAVSSPDGHLRHPGDRTAEASWKAFCRFFAGHPVSRLLTEARNQHLIWNHKVYALSQGSAAALRNLNTDDPTVMNEVDETVYLQAERAMEPLHRKLVMATQNRIYEHLLKTRVEPSRLDFGLAQYMKKNNLGAAPVRDGDVDAAYMRLRSEISRSLYFANEAYATAGGVLQVVGGKQQRSRKVGLSYGKKQSFHNIAYTAHELIQSAVDQLADIHKEAHRHFRDKPRDLGGTLLATGKYIHRLFNALKHLYVLMNRVKIGPAGPRQRDFKNTFPGIVTDAAAWTRMRRFGFGLEGLKKAPPAWPDVPEVEAFINKYWRANDAQWAIPKKEKGAKLLVLLAVKFGLAPIDLRGCFGELGAILEVSDRKLQLPVWLATLHGLQVRMADLPLTLVSADTTADARQYNYYRFFERLVQNALEDYYEYASLDEALLKQYIRAQGPPYYWADPPTVDDDNVIDLDMFAGWEDEEEEEEEEEYEPGWLDDIEAV